jgi:chemosensory pili system protein ChpA (sensor histidine kinase/response regulator)
MSQDKEREIQLQFLEEAQEYLDTIESVLLDLASSHIDAQKMDAVLRAAHSVKGGAGMMGYGTLSQLAHRLEDSFKVLKAQRNSIIIDAELESLLLGGMDRLRQVLTLNRQGADVDLEWLATVGNPVFEKLHERLGDPVADDASTMLGAEDGTNVAALLFETEVEGCLNRLEAVLADPQAPCLEEELSIMAQELGGLGEMLQLEAFTQLCESILQHLETAPERLRETAGLALTAWRRSQALVLVGQVNSLPTSIDGTTGAGTSVTQPAQGPTVEEVPAQALWTVEETWPDDEVAAAFDTRVRQESLSGPEVIDSESRDENVAFLETSPIIKEVPAERLYAALGNATDEVVAAEFDTSKPTVAPRQPEVTIPLGRDTGASVRKVARTEPTKRSREEGVASPSKSASLSTPEERAALQEQGAHELWREVKADATGGTQPLPSAGASKARADSQENTVRIPVRQLDRLNDLFGELTIERNGLGLQLGRLRNLLETLSRRVSTLERSNKSLRTAYDKVATGSAVPTVGLGDWGHRTLNWGSGNRGPLTGDKGKESGDRRQNPDRTRSHPQTPIPNLGDSELSINSRFDVLEMDRYSDLHLLSQEVMETIVQIQEVTSDIGLSLEDTDQTARELNQTAKQLQTNLTRVRMRPLSELVGRFSRALRDLSLQYGKLVELKVSGSGTLIDRSILEALSDPLMHLVRNAFDHGIEDPATRTAQGKPPQGVIEIKAAHRGNQTIITVSDDGNGINLNKIRTKAEAMGLDAGLLAAASEDELLSLIFEPGFSTADKVTDLSGRGVGMDVVRNNLTSIRGDIRVDTQANRGTTFTLTVPFTLSVARVLLVESNGMLLAFPTDVIEEMLLLKAEQVLTTPGSEVLNWEEEMVPLTRLSSWLTFYCPRRVMTLEGTPSISEPTILMVSHGEELVGLIVERCWGEREVAIRQVEGPLVMPAGMSSCTILGDGKVVPLVDATSLLRWIASSGIGEPKTTKPLDPTGEGADSVMSRVAAPYDNPPELSIPHSRKDTILVVDDSINVRRFLALALEKAGYLVEQAKDGQDAVEKLLGGLVVSAVICDIEMPRLDGYGFLARIKSDPVYERLPIAMLTSRSGDKHRQLAMTLGAAAYFSKPYNERELLRTMRQIITESRASKPIPLGVG